MAVTIPFWQVIVLVGVVCGALLLGFLSGAFVVYRTKRDAHEPFIFSGEQSKGEVFSIDTSGDNGDGYADAEELPELIKERSNVFSRMFTAKSEG